MFTKILLIAFAVAGASANINFQNCGKLFGAFHLLEFLLTSTLYLCLRTGSQSTGLALRIRGCDAVPCTFERGGSYYGEIEAIKGKT